MPPFPPIPPPVRRFSLTVLSWITAGVMAVGGGAYYLAHWLAQKQAAFSREEAMATILAVPTATPTVRLNSPTSMPQRPAGTYPAQSTPSPVQRSSHLPATGPNLLELLAVIGGSGAAGYRWLLIHRLRQKRGKIVIADPIR